MTRNINESPPPYTINLEIEFTVCNPCSDPTDLGTGNSNQEQIHILKRFRTSCIDHKISIISAVIVVILSIISIAALAVGISNLRACPMYHKASVWLIVFSVVSLTWCWLSAISVRFLNDCQKFD